MHILAISGSLRAGSSNGAILRTMARLAPSSAEIELYEGIGTLPHFNPDLDQEGAVPPLAVADFRARVAAAGGLVICSPEYAHGVPGSLKNALDWLVSVVGPVGKPVVVIGASPSGGAWVYAQLVETLKTMAWRVLTKASLHVQLSRGLCDERGELGDPALIAELRKSVTALVEAAQGEN